jgi:multiple sugar transport system permease protein
MRLTRLSSRALGSIERDRAGQRADRGTRFLIPLLVILGLTSLYPTFYSLYMSFFDWNWGQRFNFVGLSNYVDLLGTERFQIALWNTIVFTIGAVAVELVLGMGLALVVNRLGRGAAVVRTLLLVPLMVSGIVVALTWKIILDPTIGPVNLVLRQVGIPPLGFLGDPSMGMASIILIDTWWQTAFVFIVFSAGLQALPREPLEAAEVDGAGFWARLRFVMLPMLRPIILVILLFRTIDCMKVFAIIFGTTGGGPLTTTESVQVYAYRIAFRQQEMSLSMAAMVIFAAIVLAVVMLIRRANREPGAVG